MKNKRILAVITLVLIVVLASTGNIYGNTKTEKEPTEILSGEVIEKLAKKIGKQSKATYKKVNKKIKSSYEQEEEAEPTSKQAVYVEPTYEEEYIEEPIQELSYGDSGRLVIEDVGISVPLYLSVCNGELHQYYVDMPDCACIFDNRAEGCLSLGISDHNYQGFDGLYYATPGMIARILYSDGTESDYVCTYLDRNASSDEYHIIDSEGRWVAYMDPDILYMYTCNSEGWWSVTVTLWMPC